MSFDAATVIVRNFFDQILADPDDPTYANMRMRMDFDMTAAACLRFLVAAAPHATAGQTRAFERFAEGIGASEMRATNFKAAMRASRSEPVGKIHLRSWHPFDVQTVSNLGAHVRPLVLVNYLIGCSGTFMFDDWSPKTSSESTVLIDSLERLLKCVSREHALLVLKNMIPGMRSDLSTSDLKNDHTWVVVRRAAPESCSIVDSTQLKVRSKMQRFVDAANCRILIAHWATERAATVGRIAIRRGATEDGDEAAVARGAPPGSVAREVIGKLPRAALARTLGLLGLGLESM